MWLPYDDSKVDNWFAKETDYLVKLNTGQVRMAGLFDPDNRGNWNWITPGRMDVLPRDRITHYMVIPK